MKRFLLIAMMAAMTAGCAAYAKNMSALKANEAAEVLLERCHEGNDLACAFVMRGGGGNVAR